MTEAFAASELVHGGYRVIRLVGGGRWEENCYIVKHLVSMEQVIIDPGYDPATILKYLKAEQGPAVRILLTHPHHDHIGAAAELSTSLAVPCELHAADFRLLKHSPMYALQFAGETIFAPDNVERFDEESFRRQGLMEIDVLHTPGHTKGGVCYLFPGFVFTGDTLLHGYVGRTDLPGGDSFELSRSVTRLLTMLPEKTIIFPGHMDQWDVSAARHWWHSQANQPPQYGSMKMDDRARRGDSEIVPG